MDDDDECKNSQRMLMKRGETKCININYSGPKMASLCSVMDFTEVEATTTPKEVMVVAAAAAAVEWNNAI